MRLRELTCLVEEQQSSAAWIASLPPSLAGLVGKRRKIILKDGRVGLVEIEPNLNYNSLSVSVLVDGVYAGGADFCENRVPPLQAGEHDLFAEDRGSWSVSSVVVNRDFQRQGIASGMYDIMARAGMKIIASGRGYGGSLKPDGAALWASRMTWKNMRPVHPRFWKPKPRKKA